MGFGRVSLESLLIGIHYNVFFRLPRKLISSFAPQRLLIIYIMSLSHHTGIYTLALSCVLLFVTTTNANHIRTSLSIQIPISNSSIATRQIESDDSLSNIRSKDSDSISLKAYKDSYGEDAAFETDFGSELQGYTPESFGRI